MGEQGRPERIRLPGLEGQRYLPAVHCVPAQLGLANGRRGGRRSLPFQIGLNCQLSYRVFKACTSRRRRALPPCRVGPVLIWGKGDWKRRRQEPFQPGSYANNGSRHVFRPFQFPLSMSKMARTNHTTRGLIMRSNRHLAWTHVCKFQKPREGSEGSTLLR